MNQLGSVAALFIFALLGCKSSEDAPEDKYEYFPVLSYIKGQVNHVDTSLFSILKVTKSNGVADTVHLRREDFKAAAADFLSIPDISVKKWRKRYTETRMFDPELQKVIINYVPKDKEEEIQREDVLIEPNAEEGDKVQTIYIDRLLSNEDSTVQKKMLWEVDKRFQVITITQKKNAPEKVQTTEVTWSTFRSAE